MRRRLLIATIFLLAGAVVNVAVAWGCALWSPVLKTKTIDDEPTYLTWGIGWRAILQPDLHGDNATIEAGLPLPSVGGEYGSVGWVSRSYYTRFLIGWELQGKRYPKPRRPFPVRPLWIGCAINTLFYATLLWLLIPGLFVLRRFVRVRRGLCPKCAYPMGESAVCTECGRELPQRVRAAT